MSHSVYYAYSYIDIQIHATAMIKGKNKFLCAIWAHCTKKVGLESADFLFYIYFLLYLNTYIRYCSMFIIPYTSVYTMSVHYAYAVLHKVLNISSEYKIG